MSPQVTASKTFHWDMAHRLGDGYTSKCRHLHGHRYVAEVVVEAGSLDEHGMVLDFGEISRVCDTWIQEHLDHATLVCERDTSLRAFLEAEGNRLHVVPFNTTAEQIAAWLAEVLQAELEREPTIAGRGVRIVRLRLNETPRSVAEWRA